MAPLSHLDTAGPASSVQRRGIGQNLGTNVLAELTLAITATLFVATRVYVRVAFKYSMKWDDWTICLAVLFAWGLWAAWWYCCVAIVQTTISTMAPDRYSDFLKFSFLEEFLYVNGCNVVKISILFFYLRALGTTPRIRYCIYALFAFTGAYSIARFFSTLFECIPVSYFWNRDQPGHCVDYYSLLLTLQIVNVLLDFTILLFPIPIIMGLTMPTRRKLGLCVVFCLGTVACAGSAIRIWLIVVVFGGDSTSLFRDDVTPKLVLSAYSELCFGIIAASMPALRGPTWNALRKLRRKPRDSWDGDSPSPSPQRQLRKAADEITLTMTTMSHETYEQKNQYVVSAVEAKATQSDSES